MITKKKLMRDIKSFPINDSLIRKQTLEEVLKEMNLLNVGIDDSQHYIWEAWRDTKERLEQKIKESK